MCKCPVYHSTNTRHHTSVQCNSSLCDVSAHSLPLLQLVCTVYLAFQPPSHSLALASYSIKLPFKAAHSLQASAAAQPICSNTCFKANDGACDDGRDAAFSATGNAVPVQCDLGTDCADCGSWHGAANTSAWCAQAGRAACRQAQQTAGCCW